MRSTPRWMRSKRCRMYVARSSPARASGRSAPAAICVRNRLSAALRRRGPFANWGMGLTRLPRLVGRNRVLHILLIGETFDAAKAHELGLVTKVVPRAQLMQEAKATAERIAKASPTAILATRKAVAYNLRHGWDEMVRYEEEICTEVFGHPDAHEGPK